MRHFGGRLSKSGDESPGRLTLAQAMLAVTIILVIGGIVALLLGKTVVGALLIGVPIALFLLLLAVGGA